MASGVGQTVSNPGSEMHCRQSPWMSHLAFPSLSFPFCETSMGVLRGLNRIMLIKCLAQVYCLAHRKHSTHLSYYLSVMLCKILALILRHLSSYFNASETKIYLITAVLAHDFLFPETRLLNEGCVL